MRRPLLGLSPCGAFRLGQGSRVVRPRTVRLSSIRHFRTWNTLPRSNGKYWAGAIGAGAALSLTLYELPVSFLEAPKVEDEPETFEERMLAESEIERQNILKRTETRHSRIVRIFYYLEYSFRRWIIEPVATGFRFFHLFVIFVPVVIASPLIWIGKHKEESDMERSGTLLWYTLLVCQLERAGPAFIKLGQWAASRTDIFPQQLCDKLSKLHSNVEAHSLKQTKRIIRKAFNNRPMEEIFDEFHEVPLGIGAIAQVYRKQYYYDSYIGHSEFDSKSSARSKKFRDTISSQVTSSVESSPSSWVAIKVLHPRVDRIVSRDLKIMTFFAKIVNRIPTMEWLSLPDEVAQFGEMMKLQLDLRIEAQNLVTLRNNFSQRRTLTFPTPYQHYTTREVLVEEFSNGEPLASFLNNGGGAFDKEIADMGMDAFLHMLILDNFTHADLHPGNIMVRFYKANNLDFFQKLHSLFSTHEKSTLLENDAATTYAVERLKPARKNKALWIETLEQLEREGYRPQLTFIDTGLITELNAVNRRNFLDLFTAVASFDGYHAGQLMVERCRQPSAVKDPDVFALKMQHLVLAVKGKTFRLGQVKVGDILEQVLTMVRDHHVRMEGDFINVVISILLLEGIGRQLNPNQDLFKSAIPFLRLLGARNATHLKEMGSGNTERTAAWLKVWLALELRQIFLSASPSQVDRMIRLDFLTPNI